MVYDVTIKSFVSLAIGLIYWLWAFLVYMVYSFMPVTKIPNSIIFTIIAPILYLAVTNWVLKKIFKETDRKMRLINLGITVATMLLSVEVIDILSRVAR